MNQMARLALLIGLALLLPLDSVLAEEDAGKQDQDPLQIVVSIHEQRLVVYRGDQTIAESPISSGKSGYSTPTGIFSILHKKRRHFSNIYDSAPMPFMQRLTWTGIALHGSNSVPSYPASHGCVRLPFGFDEELYAMTEIGAHVVVNGEMLIPKRVSHPVLPQPFSPRRYDVRVDHWRLRMSAGEALGNGTSSMVSTADMLAPVRQNIALDDAASDEKAPLRIMITRLSVRERTAELQRLLNLLDYDAGPVDGYAGRATRSAILAFQSDAELPRTGTLSKELLEALYDAAGEDAPKNGKLLVRRDFEPLFEAPITIADIEMPLGTHLLTAVNFDRISASTQWQAYTLENRLSEYSRALFAIDPDASEFVAVEDTLDRIEIPDDLQRKLAAMLTPGSSIVIADNGSERHTGWKTDFVINTQIDRTRRQAVNEADMRDG